MDKMLNNCYVCEVYLLMPMDRVMLYNSQLTISCCTQLLTLSVISRQQMLVDI